MADRSDLRVLIVGAGFGGIAAAAELGRHGFSSVTLLESAPEIGGTWFHNTYPGAACDVPSALYSYSFAPETSWTRPCAPQPEILDYLQRVAADTGITPRVHTGSPVASAAWDEAAQTWTATTTDGRTFTAELLVLATGQLNRPRYPEIPGLETFAGEAFHSARWEHDVSLAGKRVAVIGNGASAVQFVPEIAKEAAEVVVFQRTGNWFLPRTNQPYPKAFTGLLDRVPAIQTLRRRGVQAGIETVTLAIRHPHTIGRALGTFSAGFMRWQLRGDPELRAKVWPDYTFGCKRVLTSSHFLPALRRENVTLVTDRIAAITPGGVRTDDGEERPFDVLIHATGFHATEFVVPMEVVGQGGQRLQDAWSGGAHAHLGMTVPGYPSMVVMYGPNTNTSGGSILVYLEAQAAYLRQAAELLAAGGGAFDVRPDVEAASDAALQARFAGTAWLACDSWYRDEGGRIVTNWPDTMRAYVAAVGRLDPDEFVRLGPATTSGAAAAGHSTTT